MINMCRNLMHGWIGKKKKTRLKNAKKTVKNERVVQVKN
jgi:hypothetical protein